MSKFLNILIISLVLTILLQMYIAPAPTAVVVANSISIKALSPSTSIPHIPQVILTNNSTSSIRVNTCRDITVSVESRTLDFGTWAFCTTVDIAPSGYYPLPFQQVSGIFTQYTGTYIAKYVHAGKDYIATWVHSPEGGISRIFSTLFYEPIYNLFIALLAYTPGHQLGWAIIIITLMIRMILVYPQHRMLVSQKRLQVIQPKIKEIQEKHKNDQAKLGQEMIELYKKEQVNPLGSCLPLIIQMPILIGLYWVISSLYDPANIYHTYSFLSFFDTSAGVDTHFAGVDLLSKGGIYGAILATLLAITQHIQARLSFVYQDRAKTNTPTVPEKKKVLEKDKDGNYIPETPSLMPDPEMMKKLMLYMLPLFIAFTGYFFPLGVGLYWLIGTGFVILQQAWVNRNT